MNLIKMLSPSSSLGKGKLDWPNGAGKQGLERRQRFRLAGRRARFRLDRDQCGQEAPVRIAAAEGHTPTPLPQAGG